MKLGAGWWSPKVGWWSQKSADEAQELAGEAQELAGEAQELADEGFRVDWAVLHVAEQESTAASRHDRGLLDGNSLLALAGYFSMFSPAISNQPSAIRISEIRLKADTWELMACLVLALPG
jgi:hypothetical protein